LGKPLDGRVAVVTGGGGGIGSAVSHGLARQGAHVVVVDPGVGVEGEPLNEPTAAAVAGEINASGGSATSSTVSVTDHDGLGALLHDTRDRYGSLDIVVNPAGILRYAKLPDTVEDDWLSVLDVHFNGYLNVLRTALPVMVDAGYGRIVGFTSGVGLARTAGDAMIYGAAKRAVAALTWLLGPTLPGGIAVNALSPIAATRMVRSTLVASGAGPSGLDLSAMPQPHNMAPAAAYLAGEGGGHLRGQIVFSAGSELSLISPPRLLEAIRTDGVHDVESVLATVMPVVLAPAESHQRSGGGSNPRFGDVFSADRAPEGPAERGSGRTCLVVSDDPDLATAIGDALPAWGIQPVGPGGHPAGFDAAAHRVATAAGPLDAVVVASTTPASPEPDDRPAWGRLLDAQAAAVGHVMYQAAWLRAAARYAFENSRPLRLVLLTTVKGDEGRPTAQAVAQIARSINDSTTPVPLDAFSVTVEGTRHSDMQAASRLVARLVGADDALALRGAELVVSSGWLGLRSHPEPAMTVSFGGPAIPASVADALREAVRRGAPGA
jgi:NAD(P)-dependent dehydrogenase (short-subunit alcohol dehydrogenase family)